MKSDLKSAFILILLGGLVLGHPLTLYAQNDCLQKGTCTMRDLPYCKKETRDTPPQWVTITGFDSKNDTSAAVNKNYLIGEQSESKHPFIVPKRSVVQLHPLSQALFEQNPKKKISPRTLLGVRVLSVPPDTKKLHENANPKIKSIATYREHFFNSSIKPEFAGPGSVGFVKFEDLEKVEDQKGYIFMLKKDSPLYKNIASDTGEEAIALELAQENKKYLVNHCCGPDGECRDFAIYKALNPKTGNQISTRVSLESDCESCLANEMIPMKKDFVAPLQSLLDVLNQQQRMTMSQFNFVDSRGFVQLPVSDVDPKTGYKKGPFGSLQYEPEPGHADTYLKPEVACGFTQLLKTYQKKHCLNNNFSCQVEFGNASHALHVHRVNEKIWPSNGHTNGECIDIRPMYNIDTKAGGRSFKSEHFNKEKFSEFLKLASELGSGPCFTSRKDLPNCLHDEKHHDDHLHICFPRKIGSELNPKLMKSCLNGVK